MKRSSETHLAGCDRDGRSENSDHASRQDLDSKINESLSIINFQVQIVDSNTGVRRFSDA